MREIFFNNFEFSMNSNSRKFLMNLIRDKKLSYKTKERIAYLTRFEVSFLI